MINEFVSQGRKNVSVFSSVSSPFFIFLVVWEDVQCQEMLKFCFLYQHEFRKKYS